MPKFLMTLIIGGLLGAATIKTVQYLNFQIPTPVATLTDGAIYEGDMIDGVINGQGRMRWKNGDRYEGAFENGLFHGLGKFKAADGFSYEGEYREGAITGQGTMIYSDEQQYTGELLFSKMHGKGKLQAYGSTYEGEFVDNEYHGEGKLIDTQGNTYTGEFKDGHFHGQGVYVTTDGSHYEGEFVDGQLTGKGSYRDNTGAKYEGAFKDWLYQGQGEQADKKGNRFIGEYEDGMLTGQGEYIGINGASYEGEFDQDRYSGSGTYTAENGDVYQGEFKYGQYHGKGTLSFAMPFDDISQQSGIWRRGRLIQSDEEGSIVNPEEINETVLYNQQALLQKSWAKLEPNDPDKIDLYFLGISGDGSQAVFRREIQFVQEHFDNKLETQNKSIALINARRTIQEVPLATTTSIKKTLQEIAKRMDAKNDILFIYMSSHGSRDFEFSLKQSKMDLPDVSAITLAEMLADLPIRWKVIVVSACYSGGFIPPLKNDNSLIITAAASEQTSFGCKDDAEFTYFGEAYFKDALSQTNNFVEAFDLALEIVLEREAAQGYDHSQPQIHKPDAIQNQLELWRSGLTLKQE